MEIFVERENDLILSWHPGCIFMGMKTYNSNVAPEYMIGEIGSTGCRGPSSVSEYMVGPIGSKGASDIKPEQTSPITDVPSSIKLHIGFKNKNDDNLYNSILEIVENLQKSGDQIQINKTGPRPRKDKIKIKDEFSDKYMELEERNLILKQKFLVLYNQLKELGCYLFDIGEPSYESIPYNWYEIKEYTDYSCCSIGVCCHDDTIFYKYLKEKGLLDKYFPEWYKNRKF